MSTLQQSVGSAKVFRHTVEQLLMRIFYAPSTVKLWRKSSRTFQRYLSDDRVFKIIANTNRCDWSRLFHSDFRRIACFSPPKANGEFPRVEYHSVESKRKNMHSSRNFEFFFDAHCPLWEQTLLKTIEAPLLRLKHVGLHTVGLIIFSSISRRPPLQYYLPEVLEPIINLRIRSYRFYKFIGGAYPTTQRLDRIVCNSFPMGETTLLPETVFLVLRRYVRGNSGSTLAEAFHGCTLQ